MKIKALFIAAALANVLSVKALDVTTTAAGSLGKQIGDDTTITTLKVSGPINATDFDYITSTLTSLATLDLSEATIEASSGTRTASGNNEFNANELPRYALFGSSITELTLPASVTVIGEAALGNTSISSITIPASVTTLGDYAFVGCNSLSEINIPATVSEIGVGAWKDCITLEKATIATPMDTITDNLFDGCSMLSQLSLQPSFKSIGNSAFANCSSLREFIFPETLTAIGNNSFYNSGLTVAQLDNCEQLASIGDFAFAQCKSLETATFGNQSTSLGKGLFFDDTALLQVQLPASTTTIPAFTFKGTTAIDSENALPVSTKKIGDYALYGWEQTESLLLPNGVEFIGSGAMEGWTALQKLGAENLSAVPTLGDDVWAEVSQADVYLYVNSATAEDFKAAEQWKEFKIVVGTSAVDEILDDVSGENSHANVDFNVGDGYLKVMSHGANIANTRIYDLTGRNRYAADVNTATLTVNTSQWQGSVIIVDVRLADESRAAIKLSI